jgi:hypothetical protein
MLIIYASCNVLKSKDSCMRLQINNINKTSPDGKIGKGFFYSADIDLVNTTDSTISFWIMDCAWQWNFISNNNRIRLYYEGCDYNQERIQKIDKNQKVTFNAILVLSDSLKTNNKFKLGFILIKEKEISLVPGLPLGFIDSLNYKKENKKDIIWSKNLDIN